MAGTLGTRCMPGRPGAAACKKTVPNEWMPALGRGLQSAQQDKGRGRGRWQLRPHLVLLVRHSQILKTGRGLCVQPK